MTKDEQIAEWHRKADRNCDSCYGRGFITRLEMGKRIIEGCGCTMRKTLDQRIKDDGITLIRRR